MNAALIEHEAHTLHARLLAAAQDAVAALEEGLAANLTKVAVGSKGTFLPGFPLLREELRVVITRPIRGVTPDALLGFDEVAYVTSVRDDGDRPPYVTTSEWTLVESARRTWAGVARTNPGFGLDAKATRKLEAWYADVRQNGYGR